MVEYARKILDSISMFFLRTRTLHSPIAAAGRSLSIFRKLLPYLLPCCIFLYYGSVQASFVQADKVVVIKSKHILMLLQNGSVVKTYTICLGRNPVGHKIKAGDNRTPEGNYTLDFRNTRSKFHMSLHISYPGREDIIRARQLGVSPGGHIMLHGFPAGVTMEDIGEHVDWTKGCIAVSNAAIEEIWRLVPDGTPIEILP
jgi:murein L,D-transpeptidase YafK